MGAVALINALAGYLGAGDPKWAGLAAFALIAQAFAAKITNTEAINQDNRNSERHERTRSVLIHLSEKLDQVRKGVLAGNKEIFLSFVQAVQDQLSLEHRQWLEYSDERISTIGKFEKQLNDLKI
jgi:hypothetical protein